MYNNLPLSDKVWEAILPTLNTRPVLSFKLSTVSLVNSLVSTATEVYSPNLVIRISLGLNSSILVLSESDLPCTPIAEGELKANLEKLCLKFSSVSNRFKMVLSLFSGANK